MTIIPSPQLIVMKTRPEHLEGVVSEHKHALQKRMTRARKGDLLLLAERQKAGPALARYGMCFENLRLAEKGETERIWGKVWTYVVDGRGCDEFEQPFFPDMASDKNLGQGAIAFAYVERVDAEDWRRKGLLRPFLLPLGIS